MPPCGVIHEISGLPDGKPCDVPYATMTLKEKFANLKKKKEGAVIGFVTAGDPTAEDTIEIAQAMIRGGIDILELGLPFSDPVADGPVIQKAGERALSAGMNPDKFFRIAGKIKDVPKAVLTYYNIVLQRGLDKFCTDCAKTQIEGLVIPDLPIEESEPLRSACKKHNISLILLAAPTTPDERLKRILKEADGFLYVVSVAGVTGARKDLSSQVKPLVERIKKHSGNLPLAVGFGISTPGHVKEVIASGAQGAIVGSAFEKIIDENIGNKKEMLRRLESFARELKSATVQ
jgi:tryptophan synthase alpha chain